MMVTADVAAIAAVAAADDDDEMRGYHGDEKIKMKH